MPDQERKYGTRITTAGSTLITNCSYLSLFF